jgi:hypothetical protein
MKKFNNGFYSTSNIEDVEKDIFSDLETRLKLRAILARKKSEYFAKIYANKVSQNIFSFEKFNTKT